MTNTEFIRRLRRARKLIEDGWLQGANYRNGSYCLIGALHVSGIENFDFVSPGGHHLWPGTWNDTPNRTKAEVLACIDNSIEALK